MPDSKIDPDEVAILALERLITGAVAHKARQLIYAYRLACFAGNVTLAAQTKHEMLMLALALGRHK